MAQNGTFDFGIIGHQACWDDVVSMVNHIREDKTNQIPEEEIKFMFPNFPPRSIFNIEVTSTYTGKKIHGKYIETFISPDSLVSPKNKENLLKVNQAALVAIRHNIPISALGGFTSIVLEGNTKLLPTINELKFTTGNTLTAAFIVKGIAEASLLLEINLKKSNLLILGATGDIGRACANYFKDRVEKLFLVARNFKKLTQLNSKFSSPSCEVSTEVDDFINQADVVIAVTSSTDLKLSNLKSNVLLVDAGYPKNIKSEALPQGVHLFYGGMGFVTGGYTSEPDYSQYFYNFPHPNIAHGCILEGMTLAFEHKYEEFSAGRGKITMEKMEEIMTLSNKHGIVLAPFYNDQGLWKKQTNQTKVTYE